MSSFGTSVLSLASSRAPPRTGKDPLSNNYPPCDWLRVMRTDGEQLDIFGQINVWILACWTFCSLPPGWSSAASRAYFPHIPANDVIITGDFRKYSFYCAVSYVIIVVLFKWDSNNHSCQNLSVISQFSVCWVILCCYSFHGEILAQTLLGILQQIQSFRLVLYCILQVLWNF